MAVYRLRGAAIQYRCCSRRTVDVCLPYLVLIVVLNPIKGLLPEN